MPKKGKIGKQRKDKFYKLAKETGYRSRASFKLIQLNRKFEFLQKSRVLIDLCAAPGGWLQVAHQSMPVSSVIIGVDLVPIRPIANVITLQDDITTDKCRKALKKELKTWKADTVLHDGAPNVGKNWIHDAFTQNQLTLSALKLATEMLVKGGWFITKVFRSKDYLSLVWAFKKLFKRVHVTKPQASRNESAEIFIVCQSYLAPDHIDQKFLDPSHLFKDVQEKGETKANILQITKPSKKAEGYDDETSYAKLKASEFIFSDNHLEKLCKCNEIVFDDEDIGDHKFTSKEIKECCKDIKVLGKADLRLLLNWRTQLRLTIKGIDDKDKKKVSEEQNEEEEIDDAVKEAEDLELAKLQDAKRKKKKILKERRKTHERLNLKMIIKDDDPIIDEDRELFRLSQIKNPKDLSKVEDEDDLEFGLEAPVSNIESLFTSGFRSSFKPYNRDTKDNLDLVEENEKEESLYSSDDELSDDIEFESDDENKSDDGETTEAVLEGKQNPLVVDLVDRPDRVKDTIDRWFDKEEFANEQRDDDLELDLLAEKYEKKTPKSDESKPAKQKKKKKGSSNLETTGENELADDKTEPSKESEKKTDAKKPESKKRKKRVRLDPEGLALGSLIVQSKKMKRDIVETAYNRYASNDENLPDWFVEDEKKHYKKMLPVTAEMIREYRQRLKEINARPIKKVVEAKARKKRKAERRMEKAKKRAEKITDHPDMSAQEKADELKTIYKKAIPKEDHHVTYVMAKKGVGRRVGRPAGVKGRYKVVDKRMKKDNRKEKDEAKSGKSGRKVKKTYKKGKAKKGR